MSKYRINIVAVDFDDTINYGEVNDDLDKCTYFFPKKPIKILKDFQARGGIVILWTCRTGEHLDEAVALLEKLAEFKPDYINEDCKEIADRYQHKGSSIDFPKARKIYADLYLDDKSTVWRTIDWDEVKSWLNQTIED